MGKKLLIRVGLSVLGTAAVLTWWTIHPGASSIKRSDHIPAKIGDGGNLMEIAVESSSPATMRVDFTERTKSGSSQQSMETWEKIPAGAHSWSIDVPSGYGGYVELDAEGPKVGDSLMMQVKVDGEDVDKQSDSLKEPLPAGTAFFLQDHFEDYSKAKQEMGDSGAGADQ